MPVERIDALTSRKPLRLWPGVAAAVLLLLARFGLPRVFPEQAIYGILGAVVAGLLILVWWLFFSRAPWSERIGAVVLMVVAVYGTQYIVHESISVQPENLRNGTDIDIGPLVEFGAHPTRTQRHHSDSRSM